MKFQKTTEYALRILVYIANNSVKLHSSAELHKVLNIPKKYLQQLLTHLSKQGLITAVKGKYGGFKLSRSADSILVLDIVNSTEEVSDQHTCIFGLGVCALSQPCPLHESWTSAQEKIYSVLSETKLSDLIS